MTVSEYTIFLTELENPITLQRHEQLLRQKKKKRNNKLVTTRLKF